MNRKDLRGKWSVFFLYPADLTFMRPVELEGLENNYAASQKIGCEIYLVSCDTHSVHKAWRNHSEKISKVTYLMLVDPIQTFACDFEALIPEAGLTKRGIFIVDPDLKIVAYEINADNVGRNAEGPLRKVQACQFVRKYGGEVCPAKWTPGAGTLRPSLDPVGAL